MCERESNECGQDEVMSTDERTVGQLQTIAWLHVALTDLDVDYWLFGGWAVDFHLGRVTRMHEDVDLAVWESDLSRIITLLQAHGWVHAPEPGEDGYTGFECGLIRVELAFLSRDEDGTIYTPITNGRGKWPRGSFADALARVDSVQARVVALASLIEDKVGPRVDPAVAAKDSADLALLISLPTDE